MKNTVLHIVDWPVVTQLPEDLHLARLPVFWIYWMARYLGVIQPSDNK